MEIDLFGQHEKALRLLARRNTVLATNIANVDTPNYKARDIDFRSMLSAASASSPQSGNVTDFRLDNMPSLSSAEPELMYRMPTQPTLDGNTVESDIEQAQYADNIVQYRASLMFINGRIQSIRHALTGER